MNLKLNPLKLVFALIIYFLLPVVSLGQTNPTPQSLPYSQNFSSFTGSSTTYPAGIQGWTLSGSLSTSYPTAAPNGDQALSGGTNATTTAGVYDMNGKIGLLSTASAMRTICLAINTTGYSSIIVTYDAATQRTENTRTNGLGLQYRIGTSGSFIDVSGTEYQNQTSPTNTTGTGAVKVENISVTLPVACNNQSVVQLRWIIRDISGSGNRPSFSVDNISITGTPLSTPDIAISSAHPATTNIAQGSTNNILASFQLDVTTANATLNGISVTTAGTYTASDIATNGFKFWINSSNNLTGATQLGASQPAVGNGGTVAVTGLSQNITSGTTRYILVTADIASGATVSNTISIASTAFANITFASGNKTGTDPVAASNAMTIIACTPTNVTGLALTPGNGQITVSWTNPGCLDDVVIAVHTSSISATPSGVPTINSNSYTDVANPTLTGGAVLVYRGSSSPQIITGLTNGTTYYVKVFTRKGTVYSAGVELSSTPNLPTYTWSTSTTSTAWANSNNWTGGPANTYPGVDAYTTSTADGSTHDIATFTTLAFTGNSIGLNFNNTTSNNGVGNNSSFNGSLTLGALHFSALNKDLTIGKNDASSLGSLLTLNGVTINTVANTVIRQNSTFTATIAGLAGGSNENMRLAFGNTTDNVIAVDNSANLVISCEISSALGPVTIQGSGTGIVEFTGQNNYTTTTNVNGSTLRLNRTGGGTLPATNNVTIDGGTLRISTNQTLNNLTLASGNLQIDAGATLTINGTFTYTGGTITLNGSINYGASSTVLFTNSSAYTLPAALFANNPNHVTVNGSGGITLGGNTTINGNLTLTSGTLNIGSNSLTLNGDVTRTSGFLRGSSSSDLTIAGTAGNITLHFDGTTARSTNTLRHLTINRSGATVTLGNAMFVYGTLTPTNGTLASAGNLTLVSDASNESRVATLGAGAAITGNVTAERYIPAVARRWRSLTPTVSGSTISDWQNEIFITGTGGNTNGFDNSITNNPSLYWYDETVTGTNNNGWVAPGNNTAALVTARGYRVFIRGDRSDPGRLNGTNNTQNEVTLNLLGPLHTGNINVPISFTSDAGIDHDGWNLVGNPYHSPYDWNDYYDNCTSGCYSNIESTIWVYDANTANYKSYNAATNSGTLTNGIIPTGAAFWVKANAASPTLQLREQYKTGASHTPIYKTGADELKLELRLDAITSDEFILKHLSGATMGFDGFDIAKLSGTVNMMSVTAANKELALDCRPLLTSNDTVHLRVNGTNGNYTLTTRSLPANGKYYYLIDRKLSTTTLLTPLANYTFSINNTDSTSYGQRFDIIISSSAALPVQWKSFSATRHNRVTKVAWSTATEMNASHYEVQRSNDNQNFETIGKVWARNTNNNDYVWLDEASLRGLQYYRIKQVDADNTVSFTHVIPVNCDEADGKITVMNAWPTVVNTVFNISLGNDSYSLNVYDVNGQLKHEGHFTGDSYQLNAQGWNAGVYFVQLKSNTNGNTATLRFIKQ